MHDDDGQAVSATSARNRPVCVSHGVQKRLSVQVLEYDESKGSLPFDDFYCFAVQVLARSFSSAGAALGSLWLEVPCKWVCCCAGLCRGCSTVPHEKGMHPLRSTWAACFSSAYVLRSTEQWPSDGTASPPRRGMHPLNKLDAFGRVMRARPSVQLTPSRSQSPPPPSRLDLILPSCFRE